jgi:hypothetical protein
MRPWPRRPWAWGWVGCGLVVALWVWEQWRLGVERPTLLGARTEPASAASSPAPATALTGFDITPEAAASAAASAPLAMRPAAAEPALSAAAPLWLLEASRKPPCSSAPEPPMLSGSAAEAAEQASWQLVVARLLASPHTELRAAGLYLTEQAEALVQEAHSGQSPLVMEWAWWACQRQEPTAQAAACSSLTTQHLLDAGVGDLHSLLMAELDEAVRLRQAERVEVMLARLAQTRPNAKATERLLAAVHAALPDEMPNIRRFEVMTRAVSVWNGSGWATGFRGLLEVCHPELLKLKTHRRASCEGIAHRLADEGRSHIQVAIGLGLGEQLGWPIEEVRAQRLALDAGHQAWVDVHFSQLGLALGATLNACGVVKSQRQQAWALAEKGERWFLAQQLQASGRDLAFWAQKIKPYEPRPVAPAPSDPL